TILLAAALAATGCRSIQVEGAFKQPAELTATAVARTAPTAIPRPELGKLAFVQGGDIWVKDLPDGEAKRLTRDGHNNTPHWSPSGGWLTFQKDDGTAWSMRANGSDSRQVGPDLKVQIFWSPSTDQFAYNSLGGIYVVNADGSEKRELVPSPGKDAGTPSAVSLAWSPDSQWIAFETSVLQQPKPATTPQLVVAQTIYRIKPDGTSLTEVYRNSEPSKPFSLVDWSPDGQYLLAWRDEYFRSPSFAADGWPLFALPQAGGSPVKVSEKVLLNRDFLSWAPDGRSLALIDGGYRSTWYKKHLAVSDLSGLAQLRSEPSRADLFPAWSPDGRYVAYTSAPEVQTDGGNDAREAAAQRKLWVVQPDGSGRRPLTRDPRYRDERPQWSRDGAFILFGRFYQNEQMQVWLMRADGSDLRPVVDELTPTPGPASAWFGYYGAVGWGSLYDWWQGSPTPGQASTATASPKAGPLPTPTGATTLSEGPKSGPTIAAGDLSAFLQAAAAYLEARETLAQPEAVVSVALQNLARSKGISPTYVKRSEGEPEGWIGASADGAFLLWRQGDKAFYQTWGRGEGDLFSFLVNPV
ncbi:MAG: hypothetical protein Q7R39_11025, partial [Dehalococcoidia bacterium]|nr:hypothetical protein [Dehalococcoidia bacterium]